MIPSQKTFLYLYPIQEYFEQALRMGESLCFDFVYPPLDYDEVQITLGEIKEIEGEYSQWKALEYDLFWPIFKGIYQTVLNTCIDQRYRQHGYQITYLLFKDHSLSDMIELQPRDKIIYTDIDFKTHTTPLGSPSNSGYFNLNEKRFLYPNPDLIIDQLNNPSELRVAGFHLWDCVEKIAKRAYERGIPTLVDEDLTELLSSNMLNGGFRTDVYPSFNPHLPEWKRFYHLFIDTRKGVPWLWQEYSPEA